MNEQAQSLEAIRDIRRMMSRSSRFLSLSGLSGIAAGIWALVGAGIARTMLGSDISLLEYNLPHIRTLTDINEIAWRLLLLATAVFCCALGSAFFFTWRRARRQGLPIWDRTSRQVTINILIPLVSGGLVILVLMQYGLITLIAPLCLVFYGLALVNASKYTVNDIRYLGVLEIFLGLINTQYLGYGLYFWAVGFGLLHIIYGAIMWWRNDRLDTKA